MSDNATCTPQVSHALAVKIRAIEDTEVGYRAVCSRAYYASYHAAKAFHDGLSKPGSVGNAKGSHEQLIAQLDAPTISRERQYWVSKAISKTLRIAYQHRISADYFTEIPLLVNHAEESLTTSGQVMAKALGIDYP